MDKEPPFTGQDFDGDTFDPIRDKKRIGAQLNQVFNVMQDGNWRTLADIAYVCNAPEASVSARLRDLRKEKFGAHEVERVYVDRGLFKYRLVIRRKDDEYGPADLFAQ